MKTMQPSNRENLSKKCKFFVDNADIACITDQSFVDDALQMVLTNVRSSCFVVLTTVCKRFYHIVTPWIQNQRSDSCPVYRDCHGSSMLKQFKIKERKLTNKPTIRPWVIMDWAYNGWISLLEYAFDANNLNNMAIIGAMANDQKETIDYLLKYVAYYDVWFNLVDASILSGHESLMRAFIRHYHSSIKSSSYMTVHIIKNGGSYDLLPLLIKNGWRRCWEKNLRKNSRHRAIQYGDIQMIDYLKEQNYKGTDDHFRIATRYGQLEALKHFHMGPQRRNIVCYFYIAGRRGHVHIMEWFYDNFNVELRTDLETMSMITPFSLDALKCLNRHGTSVKTKGSLFFHSVMCDAIFKDDYDIIAYLLKEGYDVDTVVTVHDKWNGPLSEYLATKDGLVILNI